ncbi:MAG: hypothetical protein WCB00_06870 [Candidatus Acidiferrales bacterium]
MGDSINNRTEDRTRISAAGRYAILAAVLCAAAIYVGCMTSPPSLVDAVQGQIARNMLTSGDWVTARLDGVAHLEKAPLVYWAMAIAYKIFGVHDWAVRGGTRTLSVISAAAAATVIGIYWKVRHMPAPGNIASALSRNPHAYRLSMGHMLDLTLASFAYLRTPLLLAGAAFLLGAIWTIRSNTFRASVAIACMMILFFQAARLALVVFDPYLSSRPLANALLAAPDGKLILNGQYYTFSSVVFYTGRNVLMLNGKFQNLEHGAYGTEHSEYDLNPDSNLRDTTEEFAYYSDEPSADAGALPIWYLSKLKLVLTKKQTKKYSKRKKSDSHAYVAGRKA